MNAPNPPLAANDSTSKPSASDRKGFSTMTWIRIVLACLVLFVSGSLRLWQTKRIEARLSQGSKPSFDLNEIPMTLGVWKGETTKIDPNIARGTGADIVVTRRYVNQDTGVAVDMILLFGPAVNMFIHLPELCYPAAGFSQVEGPTSCPIKSGSETIPFRSLVYGKGEGVASDLQEVYYTWRYNDKWSPDVGNQKFFERIPGMYKVHLARHVGQGEKREVGNPCEALLKVLIPEMERRLNAPKPGPAAPAESKSLANNH